MSDTTYTVEIIDDEDETFCDVLWTIKVTVPDDGPFRSHSDTWAKEWTLNMFKDMLHARIYKGDAERVFPDQRYVLKQKGPNEWAWEYA